MSATRKTTAAEAIRQVATAVTERLEQDKRVRRSLPGWGRIHLDRPLPFLCVYRRPVRRADQGTERLVTSEASYLIASAGRAVHKSLSDLIAGVAGLLVRRFGSCLILEVWSGAGQPGLPPAPQSPAEPAFDLRLPAASEATWFAQRFVENLNRIRVGTRRARAWMTATKTCAPPGLPPLLGEAEARRIGCQLMGLEVAPIYRSGDGDTLYPLELRRLRRSLSRAMHLAFFDFSRAHTSYRPQHSASLGRRAMVKAVWTADEILASVSNSFDFLLQLTPINAEAAWLEFRRGRYERRPNFFYRPLSIEPIVLKRALYRAPVERIEDPALAMVFRQKIVELDRQITLLQDRNTSRFIHESAQLYGEVSQELVDLASTLLARLPARSRETAGQRLLTAEEFASQARKEMARYKRRAPDFGNGVEVREDVVGLLVSRGRLLIGKGLIVPESRVEALLQHEVGTHALTWYNGSKQPLRQLRTGLAKYDSLQEGLAVLSEYLVGGLSKSRLRLLAARVVAARAMLDGSSFTETFRLLYREHRFDARLAYTITMRTHRGGGLSKDAIYLEGLRRILIYLASGGDLKPLFIGKIGEEHIPIIRELQWRGVLREAALIPLYLQREDVAQRLQRLRAGLTVPELIEQKRRKR